MSRRDHSPKKEKEEKEEEEKKEVNILAVDDTPIFLSLLKVALQGAGYKITCVTSGKAAMHFLLSQKVIPDLFILDIDMPEMDGYELAKKIRGYEYEAPIIFLTANATKDDVKKATEVGAADYIVKPIDHQQVLAKVKKFV
jgi:CheY-like chemotaxis protein